MGTSLPLLKGTLDLLVLKALRCEPTHGYGVAQWLEARSSGDLGLEDSALYQALRRLEARGYVEAEWGVSENNRRARYYRLTRKGIEHLDRESEVWSRYATFVSSVLATAEDA
jgi:PadR family transcriptional regulator PadR